MTKSTTSFNSDHDHGHCIHTALESATRICREKGARLTALRRQVLELVWASHRPLGAYAILDTLRESGRSAAPPTVYRALDFLLEHGLVHRIASLNAFIGCADPQHKHVGQFLICANCNGIAELNDDRIGNAIRTSAEQLGFEVEQPTIEVLGMCSACSENDNGR